MQLAVGGLHEMKQGASETLPHFGDRFISHAEVTGRSQLKGQPYKKQQEGRNRYLACVFLAAVDKKRYKNAIDELNNQYYRGQANFPVDVPSAIAWLNHRRGDKHNERVDSVRDGHGGQLSFGQRGSAVVCRNCNAVSHVQAACPELADNRSQGSARRSGRRPARDDIPLGWAS